MPLRPYLRSSGRQYSRLDKGQFPGQHSTVMRETCIKFNCNDEMAALNSVRQCRTGTSHVINLKGASAAAAVAAGMPQQKTKQPGQQQMMVLWQARMQLCVCGLVPWWVAGPRLQAVRALAAPQKVQAACPGRPAAAQDQADHAALLQSLSRPAGAQAQAGWGQGQTQHHPA